MRQSTNAPAIYRFGAFELDRGAGELRKRGIQIKLQEQPYRILCLLLDNPGEITTRDSLCAALWPDDTFVEFERSLNAAMAKLRQTLGDSADNPRFIETLARRGYRFIAPVELVQPVPRMSLDNGTRSAAAIGTPPSDKGNSRSRRITLIVSCVVGVLGAAIYRLGHGYPTPRVVGYTQITHDAHTKAFLNNALPTIVTDGSRVYFTENFDGPTRSTLHQVAQSGGETSAVPSAFHNNVEIGDISPDRSRVSLQTFDSAEPEMTLWTMPITGGASTRLHDLRGRDATWGPNGRMIAFAKRTELYLSDATGQNASRLVSAEAPIRWPRWAPDGKTLRYTVGDPFGSMRIEVVSADGSERRPLLPRSKTPCCCGNWTPDGKYYVFECHDSNRTDLWAIRESQSFFNRVSEPVQLTRGPMDFRSVAPSSDGKRLYTLGVQKRGELVRYDELARRFVPYLGGISAESVAPSWEVSGTPTSATQTVCYGEAERMGASVYSSRFHPCTQVYRSGHRMDSELRSWRKWTVNRGQYM